MLVLEVDPEIKQKIDATITNANQEIVLVDQERAEINEQLETVKAENAEYQKKMV
jgi:hypothetical protein